MTVPRLMPVTKPVAETVARDSSSTLQVTPSTEAVSWAVWPTATRVGPPMLMGRGSDETLETVDSDETLETVDSDGTLDSEAELESDETPLEDVELLPPQEASNTPAERSKSKFVFFIIFRVIPPVVYDYTRMYALSP